MELVLAALVALWLLVSGAGLVVLYQSRNPTGDEYRYGPTDNDNGSS